MCRGNSAESESFVQIFKAGMRKRGLFTDDPIKNKRFSSEDWMPIFKFYSLIKSTEGFVSLSIVSKLTQLTFNCTYETWPECYHSHVTWMLSQSTLLCLHFHSTLMQNKRCDHANTYYAHFLLGNIMCKVTGIELRQIWNALCFPVVLISIFHVFFQRLVLAYYIQYPSVSCLVNHLARHFTVRWCLQIFRLCILKRAIWNRCVDLTK